MSAVVADPVTIISNGLAALYLPSAVDYSFEAMASGIVAVFNEAFSAFKSNVISAFSTIKSEVNTNATALVLAIGRNITVNGTQFYCDTKVDELTQAQKSNKQYFPAVLFNGTVYVSTQSINETMAKMIIAGNNWQAGVFATRDSYARGICGGSNARWDNVHNSSEGYSFHYHHPVFTSAHAWYL